MLKLAKFYRNDGSMSCAKALKSVFCTRMIFAVFMILASCSTSDKVRLKESRDSYIQGDFAKSEEKLYTPEVYENDQNRLMHYYLLASVGMSEGLYQKAVYFLDKARTTANTLRSSTGTIDWFSSDYKSNPIEYSYIHYFLAMSYTMLAEEGKTPAWSTPEMKDKKGNVITPVQNFPAAVFDARTVADYRQKAHAELLAWDTHLQDLKRTYGDKKFYKDDLWARMLASFLHANSDENNEKRTGELLAGDAQKILDSSFQDYPSAQSNTKDLHVLIDQLTRHAQKKNDTSSLFVLEAGVIDKYKIQRYHLGLSTLMSQVKDPKVRNLIEQVGIRVILATAPEFGLVLASGAIAGAVGGGGDEDEAEGPPKFFTDAVDRSFGFEISFPTISAPPADTRVHLQLAQNSTPLPEFNVPIVSPLQEVLATELKNRERSEMFAKAVEIGVQYLVVLIPAIRAYQQAGHQSGEVFKKLAILAGYFLAKKAIDHAHDPDIRSWSYLPKFIAADVISVSPGEYDAKVTVQNSQGQFQQSLGKLSFGNPQSPVIRARIGQIDILKPRSAARIVPH